MHARGHYTLQYHNSLVKADATMWNLYGNVGNRRSSPHQFIYYCIVKVKAKKASQSDYNYRSFLEEEEEKGRKSLNLL